jgi:hypothetical protein
MNERERAAAAAVKSVQEAIDRHNAYGERLLMHMEQATQELDRVTMEEAGAEQPKEAGSIFEGARLEGARQEYQRPAITNATPEQVNTIREQMKGDEGPLDELESLRAHCRDMHRLFSTLQRELARVAQDRARDHDALAQQAMRWGLLR